MKLVTTNCESFGISFLLSSSVIPHLSASPRQSFFYEDDRGLS